MNPLNWDAPWAVIAGALFVIVMARANGTYWLGRAMAGGARRNQRTADLLASPGYQKVSGWIARWGAPVVAVSFLTIGIQTMVNLAAGAMKMPLKVYLPAVTVGCIVWALIYSTVGVLSVQAFVLVYERSPIIAIAVAVIAAVGVAAFVVWRLRESKRRG